MSSQHYWHRPVLSEEICSFVASVDHFYDLTCGEGGHTEEILKRFPSCTVTAIDRDDSILERAKERLKPWVDRVSFIKSNFSDWEAWWQPRPSPVALLADFGISQFHYSASSRGFSFLKEDEPLDMRLDLDDDRLSASDLLNILNEKDLANLIYAYGEERASRRIARRLISFREANKKPAWTTGQFSFVVKGSFPRKPYSKHAIHPATRSFQALRIAVNKELDHIESLIKSLPNILRPDDRIALLSFHSLEDRLIKQFMKDHSAQKPQPANWHPGFVEDDAQFVLIPKKPQPIMASQEEQKENPRCRSARLRLAIVGHL